jgi:hypothetical protein
MEIFEKLLNNMEPLSTCKSPTIALLVGFLFGAIGIGIYFLSIADFFICMFVFLILLVIIPGVGGIPGWWFAAIYGYLRAINSNNRISC